MTSTTRFRILWIILLLVVGSITYLIGFSYYQSIQLSKERVLAKLKAATCTASLYIDIDKHKKLTQQWTKKNDTVECSEEYTFLQEQLIEIKKVNDLSAPVYSLVYDSNFHLFQFIVTSSAAPRFRHDYIHFPKELVRHFQEGAVIDTYESESGTWLSAFAPLKDSSGKAIGLLVADEDFSSFISRADGQLIKQSGIALATVLPFVLILFFYTRNFLTHQERTEHNLQKQQVAIINQSNIIKNQNQSLIKKNSEIEISNANLDNRVKERTKELNERTQELETFLYRSSHDIRGPLASLMGLTRLQLTEKKVEPYASLINQSTLLMAERIKSLSEVYQIKAKKIEATKIKVCALLTDVDKEILKEPKVNVIICEDFDSCNEVTTDVELMKILMKEAIHNAVYHNRNQKETHVWIRTAQTRESINIEISDNGIGMEETVKDKAFEMFFRGSEISQGIGLGLFKIKMIVDRLKGKATLLSQKGEGCSLIITLPLFN